MKLRFNWCSFFIIALFLFPRFEIHAQCSEFYGTTSDGGEYGAGTIFKTNNQGDGFSLVKSFEVSAPGRSPSGDLCELSSDRIFGMTPWGGKNGMGVLFEWDPGTNNITRRFDFDGTENGSHPYGSLIKALNGKLYGMTSMGGIHNEGVIFEWDPLLNRFTKLLDFQDTLNGAVPWGKLLEAKNGKFYGLTQGGGINNYGVLFEFDLPTRTCSKKVDFDFFEKGCYPVGSLIQTDNGKIFGMTKEGGIHGTNSAHPNSGDGVIFVYEPDSGTFTKILDFDENYTGIYPVTALTKARNGKLYGMTYGTIFEMDPANYKLNVLYHFSSFTGIGPRGSLTLASNGKLYGLTESYGGVIFEWDPDSSTYSLKHTFGFSGYDPQGSLIQSADGMMYGMTGSGGDGECGTLFAWNIIENKVETKKSFDFAINGRNPKSQLIKANNGMLYGMTNTGGVYNDGVIFELDPDKGTYVKKFDFNSDVNGRNPTGALTQAQNGKLYGMALGGSWDHGILFEWDPSSEVFSVLIDFSHEPGRNTVVYDPTGSLVAGSNGMLYGRASCGLCFGKQVFEFNPLTNFVTLEPGFIMDQEWAGERLIAGNGRSYSLSSNENYLFEWDPVLAKDLPIYELGGSLGETPVEYLIQSGNGKLYGMTTNGGDNSDGVLFEWDPATNIYTKKIDFRSSITGAHPYGGLLQLNMPKLTDTLEYSACNDFLSPSGKYRFEEPGIYHDFLPASSGCDSVITFNLTIKESTIVSDSVSACDRYVSPSGKYAWNESGIYFDTLVNFAGCDSVLAIYLHIDHVNPLVIFQGPELISLDTLAHYQWIDCDNWNLPVEGETSRTFTAARSGHYAVVVSNGVCRDTSAIHEVIINLATGLVENTFESDVRLYPNPTEGDVSIDLGKAYADVNVTITGPDGRIVQKDRLKLVKITRLNMPEPAGIYILTVTSGKDRALFRIVKK